MGNFTAVTNAKSQIVFYQDACVANNGLVPGNKPWQFSQTDNTTQLILTVDYGTSGYGSDIKAAPFVAVDDGAIVKKNGLVTQVS